MEIMQICLTGNQKEWALNLTTNDEVMYSYFPQEDKTTVKWRNLIKPEGNYWHSKKNVRSIWFVAWGSGDDVLARQCDSWTSLQQNYYSILPRRPLVIK